MGPTTVVTFANFTIVLEEWRGTRSCVKRVKRAALSSQPYSTPVSRIMVEDVRFPLLYPTSVTTDWLQEMVTKKNEKWFENEMAKSVWLVNKESRMLIRILEVITITIKKDCLMLCLCSSDQLYLINASPVEVHDRHKYIFPDLCECLPLAHDSSYIMKYPQVLSFNDTT